MTRSRPPRRRRTRRLALIGLIVGLVWFPVAPVTAGPPCPCSIWDPATTPGTIDNGVDFGPNELGVKFRSDVDALVTGVRFYKSPLNIGTHTGSLWLASTQTELATTTFTGESASGWQEVAFASPVPILANTTYVASYFAPQGHYSFDSQFFAAAGVDNPPLHALQNGVDGGNGVFNSAGAHGFPDGSFNSANYWVDVVITIPAGPDLTPPTVTSTSPAAGATGVAVGSDVTATFSEPMLESSIDGTTFTLRDPSSNLVPASVTYEGPSQTATLDPTGSLDPLTTYTATVVGGTSGVKDAAGNALENDFSWSFSTAGPPSDEGPGGPILVIARTSNPFGRYYAEILLAEGFNEFTVTDITTVSAETLVPYDIVIVGEMPLTGPQVAMLSDWVTGGGNLVAMRPDPQLAGLLGLTGPASTLSNAYLQVATATGPGVGITDQTIQFHGTADLYTLNGAAAVATLFSDATTSTANPAVTLRSVGSNGGQAASFTYDLARSVVTTRQGNPAWAGQERDGIAPIRSDDLFFGNASGDPQPDWVNLGKVAIPQADEQQRLLGNLIVTMNLDRKPLPRFWYFPGGEDAVVVMTGDDHGSGGTAGRFDQHIAQSPTGCSVADWECVRATSYVYTNVPLTDAEAASYAAQGFEVALHVDTGCNNWTPASLEQTYTSQLAAWSAKYSSLPAPATNRTHCIVWSDYATQPQVELDHGIRLDTNYYYWPGSWVQNRPGFFTGSGMPMRFSDADGNLIDVYQAATQMTDESDQMYPFTVDTLLDRATGPLGYYGAFTANMHTDSASSAGADAIVASALAHGVPVVSARQMLTWLDGRNGSSFGSVSWNPGTLSFTVVPGAGANGLRGMVPTEPDVGSLTGITRDGGPIAFNTRTIKGIEYAFFAATAGAYAASYAPDTAGPFITDRTATPGDDTATITWTTDEPSDSRVDYGTSAGSLTSSESDPALATGHSTELTGLVPNTTYYFRVRSADGSGNETTSPPGADPPDSFITSAASFTDTTVADFEAGTLEVGTSVSETDDGEVILTPTEGAEFSGSAVPAGWFGAEWSPGGSFDVGSGRVTIDEARVGTDAVHGAGRSLEFTATFSANNQHVGFSVDFNGAPWAIFSTFTGGGLYARTNSGIGLTDTLIPGSWLNAPHRYRIDWTTNSVAYFIDGAPVATHAIDPGAGLMRPLASDLGNGSGTLSVDWMRMSPYASSGTFTSRVFDGTKKRDWGELSWIAGEPAGTDVVLSVRTGDTAIPDGTWTPFAVITSSGDPIAGTTRYVQYRAELSTTDPNVTPALELVSITHGEIAPVAQDQSVTTNQNTPVAITLVATDEDGDTLTYSIVGGPSNGVLSGTGANRTYTPNAGFTGSDQFTFRANDGTVDSNLATVSITVVPTGDPPTITSFTPTSGGVGVRVIITGTRFAGATSVTFDGVPATFRVLRGGSRITTNVPSGATSGPIAVTTPGGTATTATDFVVQSPPTITSFSPTSGPVGTQVTIVGTGFTGATEVRFRRTSASFTVVDGNTITAFVPAGATSGRITVITPGGTARSQASFTVT